MNSSHKRRFFYCVLIFIITLGTSASIHAQDGYLSGTVIDSATHEPLAFVSIVYNQSGQGVVTNLDGIFRIPKNKPIRFLKFRYVGYKDKSVTLNSVNLPSAMVIAMSAEPYEVAEVIIKPSENPAHRIIRLAAENRNANNPEKSGPFSYISYDKMTFGLEPDTLKSVVSGDSVLPLPFKIPDSLRYGMKRKEAIDMDRLLNKQYLFMMENVSSRKFFSPEKNKEEIIASKVSGVSQPSFVVLARQFQSFSFYDNFITIANQQFLNPIANGSTDKYFFQIQDTLFTEMNDTVFIISFRPYKGRTFEGMKGVLYINSHGYAIQNVLAEASDEENLPFKVSIQQQYDLIEGKRWFPVLLSSTLIFRGGPIGNQVSPQSGPLMIVGTGKSYIVNINFNPEFKKGDFSDVQIEMKPDAARQSPETWNAYRIDTLNRKEAETYRVIDSIGKAQHLDRTLTSFETILTGYLPGRYFAFDLRRFIDYNGYEGFRFGAGGKTTERVSRFFTFGGYLAYSLRDAAFKYSGNITLNLVPKKELGLNFLYLNDVRESGGVRFNETWNLAGSAFIREYMVEVMDITKEAQVSLSWRSFRYLTARLYGSHGIYTPTNGYGYSLSDENPQMLLTTYNFTEAGIRLRYAFQETYMKTPRGNKFSLGTKYPVVFLNIARGDYALNGYFKYWRSEAKVTKVFKTKSFGDTRVALIGGIVTSGVPYSKLYAGLSSYKPFTLEAEQSFGTMRFNEFLSDHFVALFVKQDFGKLLFKPGGKFQPEIALVQNMGYGYLTDGQHHENIAYKTMEKGYFESGILVNNIFRLQIFRYGMGVLYRYGPYAYPKTIDNFAFKLTVQLSM